MLRTSLIGKVSTLPLRDNAGGVVGAQGAPEGPNGPGSLRLGPQDRVLTNLGMTRTIPAIPLAFGGLKVAPVRFRGSDFLWSRILDWQDSSFCLIVAGGGLGGQSARFLVEKSGVGNLRRIPEHRSLVQTEPYVESWVAHVFWVSGCLIRTEVVPGQYKFSLAAPRFLCMA